MFGLPDSYWLAVLFLLGTVIGSFLNVYIYRFHTGKSLQGNSHCLSCHKRLYWYELVPLVSYVFLRGRCRGCGSHIPLRYFLVELTLGLLFVAAWVQSFTPEILLWWLVVLAILLVITVYDLYHMIIPDELVITLGGLSVLYVGWNIYTARSFEYSLVYEPVLGALIGFGFYAALWWYSKGRWIGFGDAKLAIPLGAVVGLPLIWSMIVFSFWIGAVISLFLLGVAKLLKRGQVGLRFFGTPLTMKSEVPFAPFLIVAFIITAWYRVDIFSITEYALNWII